MSTKPKPPLRGTTPFSDRFMEYLATEIINIMPTIVPLEQAPCSFQPRPGNPNTKKLKNSVVVFTRKDSSKAMLQIRMDFQAASGRHQEVVNVELNGEEAMKIANALAYRSKPVRQAAKPR